TKAEATAAGPVHETGASSGAGHEAGTSFFAPGEASSVDDFYESQTIDYTTAHDIYVLNWDVTNDARMDDPVMYEHEITIRERFEKKFVKKFERWNINHLEFLGEIRLGEYN
ncbi:hypothetical protein Tco_0927790, partial [Tanacetum coccineum]